MAGGAKNQMTPSTGIADRLRGLFDGGWSWATGGKLAIVIVLLVWPFIYKGLTDDNYALNVMTQAGLYAILTLSVGLLLGQAGQLSFGHSAFYGIGAYVCGQLVIKLGVPTFVAWLAGAAAAGIVALDRRSPGTQTPILLPCPGHHESGPDIPRRRVRVEAGGRIQRVRRGGSPQHLRIRVRHPAPQVLHGLGRLPADPVLPRPAPQVPGG